MGKIFLIVLLLGGCFKDPGRSGKPIIPDFTKGSPAAASDGEDEQDNEELVLRPSGDVIVNNDVCSCQLKKTDILNNCEDFCRDKNDVESTLYASVRVKESIRINDSFKDLYGWCTQPVEGFTNPGCQLRLQDGNNSIYMEINIQEGSNFFTAVLNDPSLRYDTTYIGTIVVSESTPENTLHQSYSESFQFRRIKTKQESSFLGTLKTTPVSQYHCVEKQGAYFSVRGFRSDFARVRHYYYPDYHTPPLGQIPRTVGEGILNVVCHDAGIHGPNDHIRFSRLGLTSNQFSLWSHKDIRFGPHPENQERLRINMAIERRLAEEYDIQEEVDLFLPIHPLGIPTGPSFEGDESLFSTPGILQGMYLTPFANDKGDPFCPVQRHYNSPSPLFRILREYITVDTEGLYLGQSSSRFLNNIDGTQTVIPSGDAVLIKESLLKKIWFYIKNGTHYSPNFNTPFQETIMFYWPPDTNRPHIKKSYQKTYVVFDRSFDAEQGLLVNQGKRNDLKIGCIPASDS